MIRHTVQAIQILAVLGAISSIGYYALCLWSAFRFLRQQADKSVLPTRGSHMKSHTKNL